jgi:hypothetical protein
VATEEQAISAEPKFDHFHFQRADGELLCSLLYQTFDMSQNGDQQGQAGSPTDYGTTLVEFAKCPDGTWEATQTGLDVVGTGDSAARDRGHGPADRGTGRTRRTVRSCCGKLLFHPHL